MHETSFLSGTVFWYTISFVIFFFVMFRYARKPILGALDAEIAKVRDELNKARKMRVDAEAALADCYEKQKAAKTEADEMVAHAKEEAEKLRIQAEIDLKDLLVRHEQQALSRIKQAETDAIAEVRAHIVCSAVESARKMMVEGMDSSASNKFIDQSIAEISKLASVKAAG